MTPQERLDEARLALHLLITGNMVAEVTDQNGEKLRYSQTNIAQLRAYIAQLEQEVSGRPKGPMGFYM